MNKEFIHGDLTYEIIGACFEVYKEKGCGFVEPVYQECLQIELELRGIPFVAQKQLLLEYKGKPLRSVYQPDLICHGQIIVELKAVTYLGGRTPGSTSELPEGHWYEIGFADKFRPPSENRN